MLQIYNVVGESSFFSTIKTFFSQNPFQNVNTDQFIEIFKKENQTDIFDHLKKEWLTTKGYLIKKV